MFEEAAIARKDSLVTPTKLENIHEDERRGSISPQRSLVGFRAGKISPHSIEKESDQSIVFLSL